MTVPPFFAMALLTAERRLVARLRAAHATVPERAVALEGLRRLQRNRLARLARVGAVHEVGQGRWYLDEPLYAELSGRRRRMVAIAVAAAVLAALAVYFLFPS